MAGENLNDLFDVVPEGESLETPETATDEVKTEVKADVAETEAEVAEKEKVDETSAEADAETDPAPEADPTPDAPKSTDEVSQLRILLREQNRRIRELQSKVEKSTGELKEKGYIEETDEEEQLEAEKANTLRAIQLETLLETMRINPKFEDVDTVVSQSRFDDMVEGYAFATAQQQGGKAEDYIDAVAAKIWAMPNPYRFMYEKIKAFHPDFASKEEKKEEPETPKAQPKAEPKPKTAPTTISNLPASNEESGGWTSARIDNMAEEDLVKVPKDIYQRYLSGDLK